MLDDTLSAQELLALSRKELQAKAKLAGVRANAKSSFIVQELLKKSAVLKTPAAVLKTPTPALGVLCDLTNVGRAANVQSPEKKCRGLLSGQNQPNRPSPAVRFALTTKLPTGLQAAPRTRPRDEQKVASREERTERLELCVGRCR